MTKTAKILISSIIAIILILGIYIVSTASEDDNYTNNTIIVQDNKISDIPDIEDNISSNNNSTQSAEEEEIKSNEPTVSTDENGNQTIKPHYQKPEYSEDILTNPDVNPADAVN